MTLNPQDYTKAELIRFIEEARSERDAAKRDTWRAFEERDRALEELAMLKEKYQK